MITKRKFFSMAIIMAVIFFLFSLPELQRIYGMITGTNDMQRRQRSFRKRATVFCRYHIRRWKMARSLLQYI